jgi:diguanylate cyclase (GGDEF)-like protein
MRDAERRAQRPDPPPTDLTGLQRRLAGHPAPTLLLAVLLIGVLGVIDASVGPDVAFSVFYLLPVAGVAWTIQRWAAVLIAMLSAAAWLAADLAAGQEYSHVAIPVWNSFSRFAVFLVVATLITQLRRAVDSERAVARTDALTGVSNSRWFRQQASAVLCRPGNSTRTLIYLDLDDFKSVNDTQGHSGGDRALRAAAEALTRCLRAGDIVGRLGGDEFAALVLLPPGADPEGHVGAILQRMTRFLRELDPPVSFSAGAASFEAPLRTVDEAVEVADSLMYAAKAMGKGTFVHRAVAPDR